MNYFLLNENKDQLGPFTPQQLREMASRGEIGPKDYVKKDGGPWYPATKVQGLIAAPTGGKKETYEKKEQPQVVGDSPNIKLAGKSHQVTKFHGRIGYISWPNIKGYLSKVNLGLFKGPYKNYLSIVVITVTGLSLLVFSSLIFKSLSGTSLANVIFGENADNQSILSLNLMPMTGEEKSLVDFEIVRRFGEQSDHYKEFGFKENQLGVHYAPGEDWPWPRPSNDKRKVIPQPTTGVFGLKKDRSFVIDEQNRVVSFFSYYENADEDLLLNLAETYGPPKRPIAKAKILINNGRPMASIRMVESGYTEGINYNFDKILVELVHSKWVDQGTSRLRETVSVNTIEKEMVEKNLALLYRMAKKAAQDMEKVIDHFGKSETNSPPVIDGYILKEYSENKRRAAFYFDKNTNLDFFESSGINLDYCHRLSYISWDNNGDPTKANLYCSLENMTQEHLPGMVFDGLTRSAKRASPIKQLTQNGVRESCMDMISKAWAQVFPLDPESIRQGQASQSLEIQGVYWKTNDNFSFSVSLHAQPVKDVATGDIVDEYKSVIRMEKIFDNK